MPLCDYELDPFYPLCRAEQLSQNGDRLSGGVISVGTGRRQFARRATVNRNCAKWP